MIEYDGINKQSEFVYSVLKHSGERCYFKCFELVRDEVLKHGKSKSLFPTDRSIYDAIVSYNFKLDSNESLRASVLKTIWWNVKRGKANREEGEWDIWDPESEYAERSISGV